MLLGTVALRLSALVGVAGFYAGMLYLWFIAGIITGWLFSFKWLPTEWVGLLEMMILTIPHAFILGFMGCIVALPFSFRTSMIIAVIPIVYFFVTIAAFVVYMFM